MFCGITGQVMEEGAQAAGGCAVPGRPSVVIVNRRLRFSITVPLRQDIAEELRNHRPKDAPATDSVFPEVPSIEEFRGDLKRAGIEFIDEFGRRADFHALGRQTPNTMMANAGVSPRIAMELMRHTDIDLTMGPYTDTNLLQKNQAVESLPALG